MMTRDELIEALLHDDNDDVSRQKVAAILAQFPTSALELTVSAGTKIRTLPPGVAYDVSPELARLGVDVDAWPAPPAGLYVVAERTMYVRSISPMTIAHEFGHAVDAVLGHGVYASSTDPQLKQAFADSQRFTSPYAATALDEWFAEGFRCYTSQNDPQSFWPKATPERLRQCSPVLADYFDRAFTREQALDRGPALQSEEDLTGERDRDNEVVSALAPQQQYVAVIEVDDVRSPALWERRVLSLEALSLITAGVDDGTRLFVAGPFESEVDAGRAITGLDAMRAVYGEPQTAFVRSTEFFQRLSADRQTDALSLARSDREPDVTQPSVESLQRSLHALIDLAEKSDMTRLERRLLFVATDRSATRESVVQIVEETFIDTWVALASTEPEAPIGVRRVHERASADLQRLSGTEADPQTQVRMRESLRRVSEQATYAEMRLLSLRLSAAAALPALEANSVRRALEGAFTDASYLGAIARDEGNDAKAQRITAVRDTAMAELKGISDLVTRENGISALHIPWLRRKVDHSAALQAVARHEEWLREWSETPAAASRSNEEMMSDPRRADFRGQDLSGIDLSGRTLRHARFEAANLSNAVLAGADLGYSEFAAASLKNANLSGANISRCNFIASDLRDANLEKTNCKRSTFGAADMRGASLQHAWLEDTGFEYADLRRVQWDRVAMASIAQNSRGERTMLRGGDGADAFHQARLGRVSIQDLLRAGDAETRERFREPAREFHDYHESQPRYVTPQELNDAERRALRERGTFERSDREVLWSVEYARQYVKDHLSNATREELLYYIDASAEQGIAAFLMADYIDASIQEAAQQLEVVPFALRTWPQVVNPGEEFALRPVTSFPNEFEARVVGRTLINGVVANCAGELVVVPLRAFNDAVPHLHDAIRVQHDGQQVQAQRHDAGVLKAFDEFSSLVHASVAAARRSEVERQIKTTHLDLRLLLDEGHVESKYDLSRFRDYVRIGVEELQSASVTAKAGVRTAAQVLYRALDEHCDTLGIGREPVLPAAWSIYNEMRGDGPPTLLEAFKDVESAVAQGCVSDNARTVAQLRLAEVDDMLYSLRYDARAREPERAAQYQSDIRGVLQRTIAGEGVSQTPEIHQAATTFFQRLEGVVAARGAALVEDRALNNVILTSADVLDTYDQTRRERDDARFQAHVAAVGSDEYRLLHGALIASQNGDEGLGVPDNAKRESVGDIRLYRSVGVFEVVTGSTYVEVSYEAFEPREITTRTTANEHTLKQFDQVLAKYQISDLKRAEQTHRDMRNVLSSYLNVSDNVDEWVLTNAVRDAKIAIPARSAERSDVMAALRSAPKVKGATRGPEYSFFMAPSEEREARMQELVERLRAAGDDKTRIWSICVNHARSLGSVYEPTTVRRMMSETRKYAREQLGDDHPSLRFLRGFVRHEQAISEQGRATIAERLKDLRAIDPEIVAETAEQLAQGSRWAQRVAGVMLATGRRLPEVAATGKFERIEGRDDALRFSGFVASNERTVDIPVLADLEVVLAAIDQIRAEKQFDEAALKGINAAQGTNVAKAARTALGDPEYSLTDVRDIYAASAFAWHGTPEEPVHRFYGRVLGFQPDNVSSSFSHMKFYVEGDELRMCERLERSRLELLEVTRHKLNRDDWSPAARQHIQDELAFLESMSFDVRDVRREKLQDHFRAAPTARGHLKVQRNEGQSQATERGAFYFFVDEISNADDGLFLSVLTGAQVLDALDGRDAGTLKAYVQGPFMSEEDAHRALNVFDVDDLARPESGFRMLVEHGRLDRDVCARSLAQPTPLQIASAQAVAQRFATAEEARVAAQRSANALNTNMYLTWTTGQTLPFGLTQSVSRSIDGNAIRPKSETPPELAPKHQLSSRADARAGGAQTVARQEDTMSQRLILIGKPALRSLEPKQFENGHLVKLGLAQSRGFGENRTTEFQDLTAFNGTADKLTELAQACGKDDLLRVECVVKKDSYEKEGVKHRTTQLLVNDISKIDKEKAKGVDRNQWMLHGTVKEIGKPNEKGTFISMTVDVERATSTGKLVHDYFKVKGVNAEQVQAIQALNVGQPYDYIGRYEQEKYEKENVTHRDPAMIVKQVGADLGVLQALNVATQLEREGQNKTPEITPAPAPTPAQAHQVIDRDAVAKSGHKVIDRENLPYDMTNTIAGYSQDGTKMYMELGRGDLLEVDVAKLGGAALPEPGKEYTLRSVGDKEVAEPYNREPEVEQEHDLDNELAPA